MGKRCRSDQAGHRDPLASGWHPSVLALEVARSWRVPTIREVSLGNPLSNHASGGRMTQRIRSPLEGQQA